MLRSHGLLCHATPAVRLHKHWPRVALLSCRYVCVQDLHVACFRTSRPTAFVDGGAVLLAMLCHAMAVVGSATLAHSYICTEQQQVQMAPTCPLWSKTAISALHAVCDMQRRMLPRQSAHGHPSLHPTLLLQTHMSQSHMAQGDLDSEASLEQSLQGVDMVRASIHVQPVPCIWHVQTIEMFECSVCMFACMLC